MSTTSERLPLIELPVGENQRGLGVLEVTRDSKRIALPLSGVDIAARVADRVASVTVKETFRNTYSEHLEAVYIFPLSGGCAVSNFELRVGDRVIKGKVEERGEARRQYRQAIDDGKRAALLESERDDVFTVQVGNLPPGEDVVVLLTYSERLPFFEDGKTEIRLPLVVAPRYIPGKPLDRDQVGSGWNVDTTVVGDASRISPPRLAAGFDPKVSLNISVELLLNDAAGNQSLSDLSCSQHATRLALDSGNVKVELSRTDERLNRDFVLRWRLCQAEVKSALLVHRLADGTAYGMLSILPPKRDGYLGAPRDVVFVLDRSGSMAGIKMTSAARSCSILLSTLGPEDRFAIQAFDTSCQWLLPAGTSRSKDFFHCADQAGLDRGEKFLHGIDARGGTELDRALGSALEAINNRQGKDGRVPVLVVLTDGEVGDESRILKRIQNQLGDARLFCLGIDTAVNDGLLRRVASLGGGTATFVEPGTQLEEALLSVGRDIGNPLVVDLEIEGALSLVDKSSLAPGRIPDLFAGRAVTAFFKMGGKGQVTVKGRLSDGGIFKEKVETVEVDLPAIAQLWAKARIGDLEDSFRVQPQAQNQLRKQIVDLSVQHCLLTRFTAFVVVDESEIVNADSPVRQVVQPVENPAQWNMLEAEQGQAAGWGSPALFSLACEQDSSMVTDGGSLLAGQPTQSGRAGGGGFGKAKYMKAPSQPGDTGALFPSGGSFPSSEELDADMWEVSGGLSQEKIDRVFSDRLGAPAKRDEAQRQDGPPPQSMPPAPTPGPAQSKKSPSASPSAPISTEATPEAGKPVPAVPTAQPKPTDNNLLCKIKDALLGGATVKERSGSGDGGRSSQRPQEAAKVPAGAKGVEIALNEFVAALNRAMSEIESGRVPDGSLLERLRKDLLAVLNRCDFGDRVPHLQKFLRGAAVELIASLKAKDVNAAGLALLWERHLLAFKEAQAQATTQLAGASTGGDGTANFWEASV